MTTQPPHWSTWPDPSTLHGVAAITERDRQYHALAEIIAKATCSNPHRVKAVAEAACHAIPATDSPRSTLKPLDVLKQQAKSLNL